MKKYISNYMLLLITMPLILQSCGVLNTLQKGIDSYNKFAIRTNLENHGFPIYSGDNPPNIEGTFVISTATLEFNSDARWAASKTFADVYATFTYKKDKDGKEIITYSDICGDANFQSDDVTLSGEENMFTASMVTKGYYNGERKGYIICISGEKTPNGIKNVRYGICIDGAIKEQYRDDKGQQKEREIDVYRIIKDGDDLSELKSVIDERQRKLANEKAEQQRLATIEKQRQDSIVAVREAERQEQLADEKAEQEQMRQTRINNLKAATKPLMEGKWVGGWKYNNGRYENRIILTFIDYETVNFVEQSYINGNYQKTITDNNYSYQYNKPNIDVGFTSPFVFKDGVITFINKSGDKVTLKKVK